MEIVFERPAGERAPCAARARRADGVVLEVRGAAYHALVPPLPHDLAHLVVEAELGLDRGFWGVLAAGGLFPQVAVVGGRRPPHDRRRAHEVVKRAQLGQRLTQAEVLVGLLADVARQGVEGDWPAVARRIDLRWRPERLDAERVGHVALELRAAARDWGALAPGEVLERRLAAAYGVRRAK